MDNNVHGKYHSEFIQGWIWYTGNILKLIISIANLKMFFLKIKRLFLQTRLNDSQWLGACSSGNVLGREAIQYYYNITYHLQVLHNYTHVWISELC